MEKQQLAKQIKEARKKKGLTQAELAFKCNLDIRTIQRIENEKVIPRFYTIRILNNVLGIDIAMDSSDDIQAEKISEYRKRYTMRKKIRIATLVLAICLMISVVVLAFPSWVLFGMQKHVWAPYFYLLMFGHIIGIAITWRCPGCNGLLGDVFNTKYCSKCGLKLID
jgi:transcriptional regulator with XRE-family HTH domain